MVLLFKPSVFEAMPPSWSHLRDRPLCQAKSRSQEARENIKDASWSPLLLAGLGICLHFPSKQLFLIALKGLWTVISMTIVFQRLEHLSPWWPAGGTVCGGLEMMALLGEMHHWEGRGLVLNLTPLLAHILGFMFSCKDWSQPLAPATAPALAVILPHHKGSDPLDP